jgi:hypothetical protein
MKRWMVVLIAAGLAVPLWVAAHGPRPEEAVARLNLSEDLRSQVLAVFEQARLRHESLRKTADAQRAANDEAFCAIRRDTHSALAKLLNAEQLAALEASLRPRPPREGERMGGPGMRGPGTDGPGMRGPRPDGGGPRAMPGGDRPLPPRCEVGDPR